MTKFIADIGSNWLCDGRSDNKRWELLIDEAKRIGCYGVKFQLFEADFLYAKTKYETEEEYYNKIEEIRNRELPLDLVPKISQYCRQKEIKFGITPFYDCIYDIYQYTDFLKISSFDVLKIELIEKCFRTKLPVIISTGLIDFNEMVDIVSEATEEYDVSAKDLTILHCVSKYPTKPENCNLLFIQKLHKVFDNVGWSDHTRSPAVIYRAIARGSKVIEFHLDLDGKGDEYKYGHCWLPKQIKPIISNINLGDVADGIYDYRPCKDDRLLLASSRDGKRPLEKLR